jgi:hypothetical protein
MRAFNSSTTMMIMLNATMKVEIGDREHPAVVSVMPLYDPGDVLTKR